MKKARVLLLKDHKAKGDQKISVDGADGSSLYLKDAFSDRPAIYTVGEARKKAKMFGGKVENYQSKYEVEEVVTIAQIGEDSIPKEVLSKIDSLEPAYVDFDKSIGEKIYYTTCIVEGLIQEAYDNDDKELENDLRELYDYVSDYNYVTFTKV